MKLKLAAIALVLASTLTARADIKQIGNPNDPYHLTISQDGKNGVELFSKSTVGLLFIYNLLSCFLCK